jgi:hypothetical protein
MPYTLAAAAKAVRRDKTTLLRAIKKGTIAAVRDEASGNWTIEPGELHRVYPAAHAALHAVTRNGEYSGTAARNGSGDSVISAELAALHTRLAVAEAELRLKDEIITELRRSNALLADQRPVQQQAQPRRSWWFWRR